MRLKRLQLYARTLAGLRAGQWVYGPIRRAQARLPSRVPHPAVSLGGGALTRAVETIGVDRPECVAKRADAIDHGEFTFLHHSKHLAEIDWRRRHGSHLWSYNLHYFDYARDLAWAYRLTGEARFAERYQDLAVSWIDGTDPGHGDGWEPYVVSMRLVNWLYALALLGDAMPDARRARIAASLARQAGWLERRLEKHIEANHLQKNYLALAVAGLFFEGRDAARWRRKGLRGSWAAVREQILDDGVHFERSPMYHAIAMADFLELLVLCDAAGETVHEDVRQRVGQMVEAFGVLSRPDGSLHLFNDAANGIARSRACLERLTRTVLEHAIQPPDGLVHLPEAGYFGYANASAGTRLLIDCGLPGPRHQPGHAHCDLLSYELDLDARPVVVDSGVHGYAGDPYRGYARSTRAHNTVLLGDLEQSEIWDTFRVARMASVQRAAHDLVGGEYRFEGAYSPYHHPRWQHAREIRWGDDMLRVTDRLIASAGIEIRSFVHLHPRFDVRSVDGGRVIATSGGGEAIRFEATGPAQVHVGRGAGDPEGWYLPEFGRADPAPVIEIVATTGTAGVTSIGYEIGRH